MARFVREHRLTDDVADREEMRHAAAHLLVDGNEAPLIDGHTGFGGIDRCRIGCTAYRHEHAIEELRLGGRFALERHAQTFALGLDRLHFHTEQNLRKALAQTFLERPDEIGIGARHQLRQPLDHTDFDAERGIDTTHLETDDATADHQQRFRELLQL